MQNKKNIFLLFFSLALMFYCGKISAQRIDSTKTNTHSLIINLIEELSEDAEIEVDYTTIFEDLNQMKDYPLNINIATEEDLGRLIVLNDAQINAFLSYRKENRGFTSIYELQLIEGFYQDLIITILPYITMDNTLTKYKFNIKNAFKYGRSDLFIRYFDVLEEEKGFSDISEEDLIESPNARYLGSQAKLYTRYRYTYRDQMSIGLTCEKDKGEEFFKGSNKTGFDFYSGHIYIQPKGLVYAAIVGDYHAQFGQGLTLWTGFTFGKSFNVLKVKKRGLGIRPYTSTDENNFLRGSAITLNFKESTKLTLFFSDKKVDANLDGNDSLDAEEAAFTSLQNSGLHSTLSEIKDEDALREQIAGFNLKHTYKQFQLGLTAYATRLDKEVSYSDDLYKLYDFQGKQNYNLGFDYAYNHRKFGFFGETSTCKSGGIASLNAAVFYLHPRVSAVIVQRYYSPSYHVFYSTGFGESSGTQNESGIFLGTNIHLFKRMELNLFTDQFSFPWLRFGVDGPSNGKEYGAHLQWSPNRSVNTHIRYKYETKEKNSSNESITQQLEYQTKQNMRFGISYQVNSQIKLKNAIAFSSFNSPSKDNSKGFLIYQDFIYHFQKQPMSIIARYAIFDTDDYYSRIYAYENDLLYTFNVPAYFDKGYKIYLLYNWKISRSIQFWIKLSRTYYNDKTLISSSLNEIEGNTKTEIRTQLRIRF